MRPSSSGSCSCYEGALSRIGEVQGLIADAEPETTAGAAAMLRRVLAALDAHNCRSPWPGPERIEGRLVAAALGVVEARR